MKTLLRHSVLIILAILSFQSSLFPMGSWNLFESEPEEKTPPPVMYDFLVSVLELQPYLVNEANFKAPENNERIKSILSKMETQSQQLSQVHQLAGPGFQPSARLLIEHLATARKSYEEGNTRFARLMLHSSLKACATCHAHVAQKNGPRWNFQENQLKGSGFERAEFLFATRQYPEALATYRGLVEGTSQGSVEEQQTSVHRMLEIYLKAQKNLQRATTVLETAQSNENLHEGFKSNLSIYQVQAKEIEALPVIEPKKASAKQLEEYTDKVLKLEDKEYNLHEIYFKSLYLSGLIYEFLNSHEDSPEHANLLYKLALYEKIQPNEFLFTDLSTLYLKECVDRYSKTPTAKQCVDTYEAWMKAEFTGSAGENLPEDVELEIKQMRAKTQGS